MGKTDPEIVPLCAFARRNPALPFVPEGKPEMEAIIYRQQTPGTILQPGIFSGAGGLSELQTVHIPIYCSP